MDGLLGQLARLIRLLRCIFHQPLLPSVNQVQGNAMVMAAIEQAWTDSNPNAPEVPPNPGPSTKQEQGGWIVYHCCRESYTVIRVPGGTRAGLATIVGTRPNPRHPEHLVAWFHTHPNTVAEGYAQGPSGADVAYTQNSARVPGIVRSHAGYHTIPFP